ncbi:ZIP family metal transporter [Cognatishimia activa]|uniref:Zinc transporter ZupT n=1 Tax=Cognatishimia activa TaxID=1715691 RepID=A0A0P1J0E0_9RHOB|nr:ZIP family metal transporter [Cognatishimia activa]CUI76932.1 zinc transporter ZupT [Cognatishimia activa]CUK26758.1 zinc transporter ZupT [Cognatishimia activa]
MDPVIYVFLAALITALATGLGPLPFVIWRSMSPKAVSICNGIAAGLMIAASFSLLQEGMALSPTRTILGLVGGFVFIAISHQIIERYDNFHIGDIVGADAVKMLMIVGIMTLHSAAEGVGVGVAYAGEGNLGEFITAAIAIHNIPEGLAIALVLVPRGAKVWQAMGWSVFSSLPQPLLAVPAFMFVTFFTPFLPIGLGLAAGAMIWMTLSELIPEALENATSPMIASAVTMSIAGMLLFELLLRAV